MGAALQQNMGREWGLTVWKQMAEASPNKIFKGTADCYEKTVVNNRKHMATEKAKERRRHIKYMRLMTQMQLAGFIVDMTMAFYLMKLQMTSHKTFEALNG